MIVKDIIEKLGLKLIAGKSGIDKEVNGVYICDLLSWVMSHAKSENVWITIQTHPNVVAVAALIELSCIIIPENAEINEATIQQADKESIPLLISSDNGFEICSAINNLVKES